MKTWDICPENGEYVRVNAEDIDAARAIADATFHKRWTSIREVRDKRGDALQEALSLLTPAEAWAAMTPEQRLAMAKAAPKVAGRWEGRQHEMQTRFDWARNTVCSVRLLQTGDWWAIATKSLGDFPTLASAQAACDAELLRLGYVLDDGEEP